MNLTQYLAQCAFALLILLLATVWMNSLIKTAVREYFRAKLEYLKALMEIEHRGPQFKK